MPELPPLGLAFDDVLIVPQLSEISSRSLVTTRTRLAGDLELQVPLISSNMDTVTMSRMAIAMARLGGIGFLHRFLTIEDEVREVERVKRYRSHIIYDPYEAHPEETVEDAVRRMDEHGVGGLIVVDADQRLIGIITRRDVYAESGEQLVREVMTGREQMVVGSAEVTTDEARSLMHQARVEKLPLLDQNERCVGLIVIKDIRKLQDYPRSSLDQRGRLLVGASIGVVGDYLERADELVSAGADTLVIDVAHGHAAHVLRGITAIKERHQHVPLIAGNVATGDGVRDLAQAGADAIRAGIGPGSACTTRMVAGAGVPQFTSLLECSEAGQAVGVPIIADGGIRYPADLSKAIGAGAHTAMLGSLLAGTPESPGRVIERSGQKFKVYRGMASMAAFMSKQMAEGGADEAATEYVPEGVESSVPLRDSAERVIHELVGGLRSGMSYTGVATIDEFHERVKFVRVTPAGQGESRPHVLER